MQIAGCVVLAKPGLRGASGTRQCNREAVLSLASPVESIVFEK